MEDNDRQSSSSEEEEEFDAEEKADIGQASDESHRAREDAALRPGGDSTDFITVIFGCGWTVTHKGMAYDASHGRGAHVRANRSCELCGFQKSMRFSVALFGGNVACSLVKAWYSRLQFLFDEFQDSGNDRHLFDERAGEGWVLRADFAAIQTGGSAAAQDRCAQIVAIMLRPLCEVFVCQSVPMPMHDHHHDVPPPRLPPKQRTTTETCHNQEPTDGQAKSELMPQSQSKMYDNIWSPKIGPTFQNVRNPYVKV